MSENSFFFDTNIFLRVVTEGDKTKTVECDQIFDMLRSGKIYGLTSEIVLSEFVWTSLSFYKFHKKEIIDLLKGITSLKHLQIRSKANMLRAVEIYSQYNVKYIDALIASDSALSDTCMPILSYDKDFDKLGIKRYEPKQVIKKYG